MAIINIRIKHPVRKEQQQQPKLFFCIGLFHLANKSVIPSGNIPSNSIFYFIEFIKLTNRLIFQATDTEPTLLSTTVENNTVIIIA
jgi:hypothetical protein